MLKRSPFSHANLAVSFEPKQIKKIVFISSYAPRKCGIAVFCHDAVQALRQLSSGDQDGVQCYVVAVNDNAEGYLYNRDEVRFEVGENDAAAYSRASDYINAMPPESTCVILQHEYGLYGRDCGVHILSFLRLLRVPVVSIFHTILMSPNVDQRRILLQIMRMSTRVVTMAEKGKELLSMAQIWPGAPLSKVRVIPHPIPATPSLPDRAAFKKELGLDPSKYVILTFGLLSPGKDIGTAIKAMRAVVDKFPKTLYIVLGATHPGILQNAGESYRNALVHQVAELKLQDHVLFVDRFVDLDLLTKYLSATDIYAVPYLSEQQITSGTLAYAYGIGNCVVSTPFWHAQELLDGPARVGAQDPETPRGLLFPFSRSEKLAEHIIHLLGDDSLRLRMQRAAFDHGRGMTWPASAQLYLNLCQEAVDNYQSDSRGELEITSPTTPSTFTLSVAEKSTHLPKINLSHLFRMTDDVGIVQHAIMSVPRRSDGYCIDDVARALNLVTQLKRYGLPFDERAANVGTVYMSFIAHAFESANKQCPNEGRFKNFMSYSREWLDETYGSEDSHGRTLQALAAAFRFGTYPDLARELFEYGCKPLRKFTSPRAVAYAIIGCRDVVAANGHIETRQLLVELAERLHDQFKKGGHFKSDQWPWLEDGVTYDNAVIPQALVCAGRLINKPDMIADGERSLKWLFERQFINGRYVPIGNHGGEGDGDEKGWLRRNPATGVITQSHFDQQSLEAGSMTLACLSTMHASESGADRAWYKRARQSFAWYLGVNTLGQPVVDVESGGCCDSIIGGKNVASRLNKNQGAESLLAYLLALAALKAAERDLGEVEVVSKFG